MADEDESSNTDATRNVEEPFYRRLLYKESRSCNERKEILKAELKFLNERIDATTARTKAKLSGQRQPDSTTAATTPAVTAAPTATPSVPPSSEPTAAPNAGTLSQQTTH